MIWAQQGLSPCYRSGNKLQTTGLFWSPGQQTQVRPKSTFYAFLRVLPAMTTRPVGISRTGVGLVSNDRDMTCLAGGSEKQKWAKGLSDKQPLSASRRWSCPESHMFFRFSYADPQKGSDLCLPSFMTSTGFAQSTLNHGDNWSGMYQGGLTPESHLPS